MKTAILLASLALSLGACSQAPQATSQTASSHRGSAALCKLGTSFEDLRNNVDVSETESYSSPSGLSGELAQQVLATLNAKTLAEAFDKAPNASIFTLNFASPAAPADGYVLVYVLNNDYGDQNPSVSGAVFRAYDAAPIAHLSNNLIDGCGASAF